MSVKDALRDCILNQGRNLPENAVLTDMRQTDCLQKWPAAANGLTKRGLPRQRGPHRNYSQLIQTLKEKNMNLGKQLTFQDGYTVDLNVAFSEDPLHHKVIESL